MKLKPNVYRIMKQLEKKLQSLELNEPPAGLKQRVLDNAGVNLHKLTVRKQPIMLLALMTSKWFLLLILPLMLVSSVGVLALTLAERAAVNEWEEVRIMLDEAGETLDWESFFPEPVPDEQNFMGTPALKGIELGTGGLAVDHPLVRKYERLYALPDFISYETQEGEHLDFKKFKLRSNDNSSGQLVGEMEGKAELTVVQILERDASLLEELAAAAKRPFSQVSTPISERLTGRGVMRLTMAHLGILQGLTKNMSLRAIAAARLGDRQKARDSLEIIFKSNDAAFAGGSLISGLVGITQRAILEARLPDILREECWTGEDLIWLQEMVAKGNGFEEGLKMFRAEMAFQARMYDEFLSMSWEERRQLMRAIQPLSSSGSSEFDPSAISIILPKGIIQKNKATGTRWIFQYNVEPFMKKDVEAIMATRGKMEGELASLSWFSFGSHIAAVGTPTMGVIAPKMLKSEMHRRMMEAAVALERFHRAEGVFPQSLGELVPQYLPAVPEDVIGEIPLGYVLDGSGFKMKATPISAAAKDKLEFIR
jgi:hypothetical protein